MVRMDVERQLNAALRGQCRKLEKTPVSPGYCRRRMRKIGLRISSVLFAVGGPLCRKQAVITAAIDELLIIAHRVEAERGHCRAFERVLVEQRHDAVDKRIDCQCCGDEILPHLPFAVRIAASRFINEKPPLGIALPWRSFENRPGQCTREHQQIRKSTPRMILSGIRTAIASRNISSDVQTSRPA